MILKNTSVCLPRSSNRLFIFNFSHFFKPNCIQKRSTTLAIAQLMDLNTQSLKSQADNAFRAGHFADAISHYSAALKHSSNSPVLYTNKAMALLKLARYQDVIDNCTKALEIGPSNVKALWRRGVAWSHLNKYIKAEEDFIAGLKEDPTNKALLDELKKARVALGICQENQYQSMLETMSKPTNAQEFERGWREYRASPLLLYVYLDLIIPSELPGLFRSSLESSHIVDIISALKYAQDQGKGCGLTYSILESLTKTDRFNLAALFLDSCDKKKIRQLLTWVKEQLPSVSTQDIDNLVKQYI